MLGPCPSGCLEIMNIVYFINVIFQMGMHDGTFGSTAALQLPGYRQWIDLSSMQMTQLPLVKQKTDIVHAFKPYESCLLNHK